LHAGAGAASAEALMRARYSAHVLADAAYLLATWHPDTRPPHIGFEPGARWLGLDVRRHAATGADSALVEFVARCKIGGLPATRLHEISRFVREGGRWYYRDGEFPRR
jgi:SEC-C motif-containing protein